MAFDFKNPYAPPGVYTESEFASDVQGQLSSTNIPMLIGPGNEILTRTNLEVVRGSSQTVDQRVPNDDMTGRAIGEDGLFATFDGSLTVVKVRNFPIVTGEGNGRTSNSPSDVAAFINGSPTVVLSVNGSEGLVELAEAPSSEDEVTVTYFFNRTDTQQTDDVSSQVSTGTAELVGTAAVGSGFVIDAEAGTNDGFDLTVDGESASITIPAGTWTIAQILGFINSGAPGSLEATSTTNNEGGTVIVLSADQSIEIGGGTANATLGFAAGDITARNTVFFTHQRPMVDGTNAGRTLSAGDATGVLVTVDGEAVSVSDVDGKNGSVTLAVAPAAGSTVEVTYFWNSWQDTFDFVFDVGVTRILRCGIEADRMDFINGSDFVLYDDKIYWGTSAIVEATSTSEGSVSFDETQITAQLADVCAKMEPCTPVTSGGSTSLTSFKLQRIPTSGNGTGSPGNEYPLSSAVFSGMTNSRRDVWSNRPELVKVWAGYGMADAKERGQLTVAKVDASSKTITLADPIDPGMEVFASYNYNRIDDMAFTLTCESSGPSGVGTYSITDSSGNSVFAAPLTAKGAGLVEILQWESGNSNLPLARFEPVSSDLYTGPVEEVVTVTLVDKDETNAAIAFGNPGPFYFIESESDSITIDPDGAGTALASSLGNQAAAIMISDAASYDASSGGTTWAIAAGSNDSISVGVDGQTISATVAAGDQTIEAFVTALNDAAALIAPEYVSAVAIQNSVGIDAGVQDTIAFGWDDDTGVDTNVTATIAADTYNDVASLATAVQTAMQTAIDDALADADNRPTVGVTANNAGQLVFAITKAANATWCAFSFLDTAGGADFCTNVAGIDTGAVKTTGGQTVIMDAPIAYYYTSAAADSGALTLDRLILRNRVIPGALTVNPRDLGGYDIEILSGTALSLFGFALGDKVSAATSATVIPAAVGGYVGWARGFVALDAGDDTAGQPELTFFDGSGSSPANNVLEFVVDGDPITVEITASEAGTDTSFGPSSVAASVLGQISAALTAAGSSASVLQVGASFWIQSATPNSTSSVAIGEGSANSILGLSNNASASRVGVKTDSVVGCLMTDLEHAANDWVAWADGNGWTSANHFAEQGGLALTVEDASGDAFLKVQSGTLGTSSSIEVTAATVFQSGTGLLGEAGEFDSGESARTGFTVTSDNPVGSGSANSSILNSGTGQDGSVGQTYRDEVTGLTFTLLAPLGGGNYSTNGTSTFELTCSATIDCDANVPITSIPGLQLFVANTSNVGAGDTATVTTHNKGGKEPGIGQSFYISYDYEKRNYQPRLFTRVSTVEDAFGSVGADNQSSLASYLMFLNGATVLGVKQVRREEGKTNASLDSYLEAFEELEGLLPGRIRPSVLVPMIEYSQELGTFLSLHVDKQSSIRQRAERTAILGFAAGTQPSEAADMVKQLDLGEDENGMKVSGNSRIRCMYPDMLTVTSTDTLGNEKEELVDGRYLAAMMAARQVSPNRDPATPWTGTKFVGTNGVMRDLDTVTMNQVAASGISVCENRPPFINVRQGLTTDMGTVMTKTPTVIQIADEVHQRTRDTLEGFTGVKFLPGVVSQIEGRLGVMYKELVNAQIVAAYTGIKANVSADDPTACEVESFYQPIFPLLYIILKFNIRSSV